MKLKEITQAVGILSIFAVHSSVAVPTTTSPGWTAPEIIDVVTFPNTRFSSSAVELLTGPVVTYIDRPPGGIHSLKFAERMGVTWQVLSIVDGAEAEFPVSTDAIVINNVVYVGSVFATADGKRNMRVLSRDGDNWQEEFEALLIGGGTDTANLTVVNDRIVGAYDAKGGSDITILEQSDIGWSSQDFNIISQDVNRISLTAIDHEPMVLLSRDGNPLTYLGQQDPSGNWSFEAATPRSFATISGWNDSPAIVGSTARSDPRELFFDYLDSDGVWQSEAIVTNNQLRDFDFAVISGIPMVSYVDADGDNTGLHVAVRVSDGVWDDRRIADASPADLDGTDIFELNERAAITYWHGPTETLRIVYQVPEPSSCILFVSATTYWVFWRKGKMQLTAVPSARLSGH